MANTLQYSCLENPPDRGAWQARSTGSQRVDTMQPCMHRCKIFLPVSALLRVECEGGVAAWLSEALAAPSVQGHRLPQPQELWP